MISSLATLPTPDTDGMSGNKSRANCVDYPTSCSVIDDGKPRRLRASQLCLDSVEETIDREAEDGHTDPGKDGDICGDAESDDLTPGRASQTEDTGKEDEILDGRTEEQ